MSTSRLHFCAPARVRLPEGASWHYLGSDPVARGLLADRLGRPPSPVAGLLRAASERLRGPFLDLVAELGRSAPDPAAWWAGTLSWKSWDASDLFLLCCYLDACVRLSEAKGGAAPLVVVVEDPWLLREAHALLARVDGVSFGELPGEGAWKVRAALLGAARRARWCARMTMSLAKLGSYERGRGPAPVADGEVLLYSYLQTRAFQGAKWDAVFFPGLEDELARAGARVVRCTDPDQTGFERELAAHREQVVPLASVASWRGFFRALTAVPPASPAGVVLAGLPIDGLLRRERWHDLSRSGRCAFLFLHDAARRLLASARWRALVMAWEGQPQERLLALAAREAGVRVVGSQHTTVSPNQLPFFLGRGEAAWAPWPDALLVAGPRPAELLRAGSVPAERMATGGSLRFSLPAERREESPAGSGVLIVLPLDPIRARHLIAAVARAYPRGGEGFEFRLKPHPGDPSAPAAFPFPVRVDDRPLAAAAADAAVVLFTSTAAGFETLLQGRPGLRYRPDALLDVDPCDLLDDATLPTAGDDELRRTLDGLLERPVRPDPAVMRRAFSELFAPPDLAVWRRTILGR